MTKIGFGDNDNKRIDILIGVIIGLLIGLLIWFILDELIFYPDIGISQETADEICYKITRIEGVKAIWDNTNNGEKLICEKPDFNTIQNIIIKDKEKQNIIIKDKEK